LVEVKNIDISSIIDLGERLTIEYQKMKDILNVRYSKSEVDKQYKAYIGQYSEKTKSMFDSKKSLIEDEAVKLVRELEKYYSDVIAKEHHYKLMQKEDVQLALNAAISNLNTSILIETDFYEIIKISDKSTWFSEWDFLKSI
jgi:hypothetical protein